MLDTDHEVSRRTVENRPGVLDGTEQAPDSRAAHRGCRAPAAPPEVTA